MDFATVNQPADEPTTYAAPGQAPPPLAPAMLPQQPVAPPQPKRYDEVLGEFRDAQKANPALSSMSLPEYSTHMNNITGTKQYDQGMIDSSLRRGVSSLDLGLHHFGGESAFGPFVKPLFHAGVPTPSQWVGGPHEGVDLPALTEKGATALAGKIPGVTPEYAGAVGKGAGGLVESAPTLAGAVAGGIPGMATMAGLQTYGETGRWGPSLLAAAGTALIPTFMEGGGNIALKLMGAKTAGALEPGLENLISKGAPDAASKLASLSNRTASGAPQILGEFVGKQLGLTANMLSTQAAQTAIDPNLSWEDKLKQMGGMFKPTSLVTTGVGQIGFSLGDLFHLYRAGEPIKQVEAQAEGQFANEFTQEWMKDRVVPPTPQETQEAIDRAKKGPTPPTTPTAPVDPQQELDLFGAGKTDVERATALAEERMKAKADPVGEVLKSMGQAPVHIDSKELAIPVRTSDEAWPMTGPTGAMETVRSRANDMLVAQGATTNAGEGFGSGHDQTLYTVIRTVEESGEGRWSKEEIAQIAASRLADVWQKDKSDLKVGGYRPSGEQPAYPFSQGLSAKQTQKKFEDANQVMAEVARKISPTIPSDEATAQAKLTGGVLPPGTGRLNPDYDQKLDQMISLISGDKEHWLRAGIPENVMSAIWQNIQKGEARLPKKTEDLPEGTAVSDEVTKSKRAESTLPANIIDLKSNLGPKMFEKIRGLEQAIQEEVARNGFFTTNTHNDLSRSLTTPGEKAIPSDYNPRLEDLQKQLMELEGLNKAVGDQRARGGVAPIADITAETYKAALQYTKEFDINNPESVGDFVRYIQGVIRNREKDWSRVRAGEPFVTDLKGNTMTFDTREAAVRMSTEFQKAADAGRGGDYEVRYTVPQTPEKDGTFRIVENRFINIFSMPERQGLGDVGAETQREEQLAGISREETTEKAKPVPLDKRLNTGEATFDDLQNEYFSKRFIALGRISDPVEREARRGALAANAADFINAMKNADFAKVITDGTGASKISNVSELKQKFIRYLQFMRDGGYVDTVPNKTGTGIIGEGNLEAFNNYMKGVGLGYGNYGPEHPHAGEPRLYKWNENKSGGNFFEKFMIFSKYMGRYMMDPRTLKIDGERRPDGDYGFLSPMIGEKFMDKVNVPWAAVKPEGAPVQRLKAASQNFPDLLYTRKGNAYDFVTRYDNPLVDLQVRSTENDLFSRAGKVVDLYERFGNVDPDDLAVAKLLMKSPFVRNQHVGFSMAVDKAVKGYFHTDHVSTSGGVLVDPYKPAAGGRMELQTPRESFKVFLEELGHSAADFAYHSDLNFSVKDDYLRDQLLSFRDEANAIHKFLVQHREDTKGLLGDQFVTDNLAHALKDPREMLAQVMSNSDFRTWLSSVPDNMDHPLPAELGFGTNMFQRLWNLVKRLFDHLIGPDASGTMLNRLAQTATRGIQLQDRMRLFNTPDIYNFLQQTHRLDTERLEALRGQAIPKPVEPTQVYQRPEGPLERPEAKQQLAVELLAARIQLQGILAREHTPEEVQNAGRVISDLENQIRTTPATRAPYQPSIVGVEKGPTELEKDPLRDLLLEDLQQAKNAHLKAVEEIGDPHYVGKIQEPMARENVEYAQRRLDIYDKYQGEPIPANIHWQINDIDSAMADAKVMLARSEKYGPQLPQLVQKYQALIQDLQGIRNRLAQTAEERLGEVLEARVNPQRVYDSMQGSATHSAEDLKGDIWFKPYDLAYFRRVYGPVFGDKLRLDMNGNQMGYKINSTDVANLTPDDVARMPPANVKPWAPSLYESMRSMFKAQGSDDQTAQAQANLMLQFGALLRSSDRTTWGVTTKEVLGKAAAQAWNPGKYVSLGPDIFQSGFAGPQASIRHEATHTSGFNKRVSAETPDVQANVMAINAMFAQMSPNQRQAFLQNFVNISHEDFGSSATWIQPLALTTPHEFASVVMEHIGDMLGNVPDPSAYLKDQMRFVPDEVSQLLRLTTWRRLQGVDRLAWQLRQAENTRGFANQLAPRLQGVTNIFKEASRSALEIAEDISEFQRLRLVYPDSYRGLLQSLSDAQTEFFKFAPERASKIPGEALESRMPPAVEKFVRNFFPLPTSDGQLPRELNFWDRQLMQFSQFAAKYPVARSFYDMLATSRAISQTTRIKMMTALAGAYTGGKVLDDVRTGHVAEFMKSPQLRAQFSKIALDLNLYGDTKYNEALAGANGQIMSLNPDVVNGWLTPQFTKSLMDKYGVPLDKRPAMQTILDGTRHQIEQTSANIVGSHIHAMESLVAKVVSMNGDLNPEQSRRAAQALSSYFKLLDLKDPDGAMQQMLQFGAAVKNPEVQQKVFDMAQASWAQIQQLKQFLQLRMPYYMSERRPGGYGLIYKDATGKVQSQYYATGDDRNAAIKSKGLTEANLVRQINPQDRDYGISQSVFNVLDEVHNRVVEKLTPLFGEEQAQQLGQVLDYANELRNSLNARDVLRTTTGRDLAPGREELDMFAAHQHYLNATTAAIRNRFIKLESELLFTDPGFANQPWIKDFVKGHVQAVLQPDGQIGRTIQQLSFFHYLWGNVSSMIMQMSHQVMGLAPQLTARGASVADSYKLLADANHAVVTKNYDAATREMVDRAKREGVITSWIARELDHSQDLSMVNRMRVTQGASEWKAFDLLKNPLYQGYSMIRRIYDLVPIYNSEVAFVAALKHLQSDAYTRFNGGNKLSGEELYNEARFLKDNTMFPGGKENRPGMFQNLPRSAAQAFWSLQTYANGLTTMMGDLIRRSVNPKGAGLTPAQGTQVRKAAAQMLIAQTAIGGVMAMPFAAPVLFALQKLFPDHDVEGDVRKTLANLAGDDGALGQSLSSIMMNGVPNSFSYGPDVGSRFALAGVFHVSPYSGVGWEQLTGPVGGIISNAFQGAQAGLRGDPMQTVESLMPTGFQRIWKTLQQGQQYQTGGGRTLVNDLSPMEIASRLIGFRPARVARIEDFQNLVKVAESAEKSEQAGWTGKQVEMLQQGGRDAEVQQNIAQRTADKKGTYSAKQLADDISKEYAERTMPINLRSFGNRATILAQKSLRGVLGTQTEGPGEMDRLQTQQQIAQRLGLGGPTPGALRHAASVDQLMQMYPHLTNSMANLLLTHAAGSRPPPDLYSELLSNAE